jgi:hypothetical protein
MPSGGVSALPTRSRPTRSNGATFVAIAMSLALIVACISDDHDDGGDRG